MKSASVPEATSFDAAGLIRQHQAGVWRYLRSLGCDPSLAEDLTQETFLAVLRQPFRDYDAAATAVYLRRTAHNLFVSVQRRAGRVTAVENIEQLDRAWTAWAGHDQGEELLEALQECLQRLTDRARLALQMRFRDRESRASIAARLELSEHGAKNLMQRAKHKLRSCIESKMA